MNQAKYFKKLPNKKVQCELCPHFCVIALDNEGKCRSRLNTDGNLYTFNYAETISISMDPIEKKPLYHFFPGQNILSIGPNSCNFTCNFCQNFSISQYEVPTYHLEPEELINICEKNKTKFVAYTYTEPITWFEYILNSAKLLKEKGFKTVLVTNGFINPEPLKELLPYIDAMNIDLKSMDDVFYRKFCDGRLQPVLDTIKIAAENCHLEITNLLITGENDSNEKIQKLVDFIAEINPNIPLHFSKYFPHYKMSNPPTPESTLHLAREVAREKLNFIYLGNMFSDNDTRCPKCDSILIKRGYSTKILIKNDKCPFCDFEIYGEF